MAQWNKDSWVNDASCPVCGFEQDIKGMDCYACETIGMLYDDAATVLDMPGLTAALPRAWAARLASMMAQPLPTASESTAPGVVL